MKKMDYTGFDDDVKVIPEESVEVLPKVPTVSRNEGKRMSKVESKLPDLARGINPLAIADKLLDTVNVISNSIATVVIEKEKTKQIRYQSQAIIEESLQRTERIRVQEEEETKRLMIQCQNNLNERKFEIQKIRETFLFQEKTLQYNHKIFLGQIQSLNKIADSMIRDKDVWYEIISSDVKKGILREESLGAIDRANTKLLELAKQIGALSKG